MNKDIFKTHSDIYLNYGYLMLPIGLSITSKIKIGTETFFSKKGYHVSLLCLEAFSEPDQKEFLKFAQKFPVRLKKITNIYRLVTQEDNQSIIVRVYLQGLTNLIFAINKHFGSNFVYPPTHITLFTLKEKYGIPVNSISDYRRLTRQIDQKYAYKLTKAFKLS